MNFLSDLKVSCKLAVLLVIALVSLGVVGLTGYVYFQKANEQMDTMYADRLVPARLLSETRSLVRTMNGSTLEIMLTTDGAGKKELKDEVDKCTREADENFTVIANTHIDPKASEMLNKVKDAQKKYLDARTVVMDLAMQNKNTEAHALYVASLKPLVKAYLDNLRDLATYYGDLSKTTNENTKNDSASATKIIIGIIFAAFLILGFSGWVIAKMITAPLQSTLHSCEELADGDFRKKQNSIFAKDETGKVMEALNSMRDRLNHILRQVNESAQTVAASSEELTANAEQSAQASVQVADSVNAVAEGTENQLRLADKASNVVKQISTAINQVAANTENVSISAEKTASTANDGEAAIKQAVNQMKIIEEKTNATSGVIAELEDKSKQIGQIVDVISSIAGQTNLLALNAAIEAARAGEAGRGFAVVAEEVRKLAEQSQNAAKEITDLIGEVQAKTDSAVVFMNDGKTEVNNGTAVVASAGESFETILKMVQEMSKEIHEISASIEEIASGTQNVVKSVQDIDDESKRSAQKTQAISAATEEQSASVGEIASASEHLAKMAESLQQAVQQFKV